MQALPVEILSRPSEARPDSEPEHLPRGPSGSSCGMVLLRSEDSPQKVVGKGTFPETSGPRVGAQEEEQRGPGLLFCRKGNPGLCPGLHTGVHCREAGQTLRVLLLCSPSSRLSSASPVWGRDRALLTLLPG